MLRRYSLIACAAVAFAATIPTAHFDNSRLSWNASETILTPANAGRIHRIGSYVLDGAVFGQPLYIPNISGRNLLVVCTMHDSCYGLDADWPGVIVWHAGPLATSRTSYPFQSSNTFLYGSEVGCLATPAVDVARGLVFAICTNSTPTWVLYSLNLSTGATVGNVTISGQVPGSGDPGGGDCVSGGMVQFCPAFVLARPAVTVANGRVYLFFGGYDDARPWHGWAIAYDETTLAQTGIFCTTPNGYGGSFWGAGGGPAVDASGNLYAATGNGSFDGTANFSDSFVKLSSGLALADWFTPANYAAIDAADEDLSANRVLLIPGTRFLVGGGKDFRVFLLDTTSMGHLQGSPGGHDPAQVFLSNPAGVANDFSGSYGIAFANSTLYMPTTDGGLFVFPWSGSTFGALSASETRAFGFPGPVAMSVSSNGSANGIVWITTATTEAYDTARPGTLRALRALDLTELWNSDQSGYDALGILAKFAAPTVANGRVYIATQDGRVQVYGLIPSGSVHGQAVIRGQATFR